MENEENNFCIIENSCSSCSSSSSSSLNFIDFEIIDECDDFDFSFNKRYRTITWKEYFRKLYSSYLILIISIIIYFYYCYKKPRYFK